MEFMDAYLLDDFLLGYQLINKNVYNTKSDRMKVIIVLFQHVIR